MYPECASGCCSGTVKRREKVIALVRVNTALFLHFPSSVPLSNSSSSYRFLAWYHFSEDHNHSSITFRPVMSQCLTSGKVTVLSFYAYMSTQRSNQEFLCCCGISKKETTVVPKCQEMCLNQFYFKKKFIIKIVAIMMQMLAEMYH